MNPSKGKQEHEGQLKAKEVQVDMVTHMLLQKERDFNEKLKKLWEELDEAAS